MSSSRQLKAISRLDGAWPGGDIMFWVVRRMSDGECGKLVEYGSVEASGVKWSPFKSCQAVCRAVSKKRDRLINQLPPRAVLPTTTNNVEGFDPRGLGPRISSSPVISVCT